MRRSRSSVSEQTYARSMQAKVLRRTLLGRVVLAVVLFTVLYIACAALVNEYVAPRVGDYIADSTSTWQYMTYDQCVEYEDKLVAERGYAALDNIQMTTGYYDTLADASMRAQLGVEGDEEVIGVRDLTIYNTVRAFKIPVAVVLYFCGLLTIVIIMLNRAVKLIDELTASVAQLFRDKEQPIVLSRDLAIVGNELNAIRLNALASDRAAQAAERRKNELVAYLAHDIRTPLTSVIGYVTLLKEAPELPEKTRISYADIVLQKAERLEKLIDEFFEITRYSLQSIPIERQTVSLLLLCEQIVDEFVPEAQSCEVTLVADVDQDVDIYIDPDKLARVLSNVMRNALAYADEHTEIRLRAEVNEEQVTFAISNQGREISAEHLERIFDQFFREDAARQTRRGGAGLGLAIAREIVTAHGGTIKATSADGLTTFTIALPLSPVGDKRRDADTASTDRLSDDGCMA